jgi:hypothetical protein
MQRAETWRVLQNLRLMIKVQICLDFKSTKWSCSCPTEPLRLRTIFFTAISLNLYIVPAFQPYHIPAAAPELLLPD